MNTLARRWSQKSAHDMEGSYCLYDDYKQFLSPKVSYNVLFRDRITGTTYKNSFVASWNKTDGFIIDITYSQALSLPFTIDMDLEVYAMSIHHPPSYYKQNR